MKPIIFNQDVKAAVQDNHVILASTVNHNQSINQHTTTITPVQIYTKLDINSKEFWELVKRAAVELRLNLPNTKQQELSMIIADAAITIQNTMDQ